MWIRLSKRLTVGQYESAPSKGSRVSRVRPCWRRLLLFLVVNRMSAKARRILLELQFLSTRFTTNRVVVITGLFADQKYGFCFLFALRHRRRSPTLQSLGDPVFELVIADYFFRTGTSPCPLRCLKQFLPTNSNRCRFGRRRFSWG